MLAGLAEGTSELRHFSAAADCHSTLACMSALGRGSQNRQGYGSRDRPRTARLEEQLARARCREFRDDMRLLAGILAGQGFTSKLTGDGSLQKRPMKRVISPLREMGADIRARDDNFAPLEIREPSSRPSITRCHGQRAGEVRGVAGGIVLRMA